MAGARALPSLVPTSPDDPAHDANVAAWDVLRSFDRPFLCTFSDSDPITKGGERQFIPAVPGTAGQPHTTIEGGGHFLQEDQGEQLARVIRSEEHTSELQLLMRISYAVFCLKKKKNTTNNITTSPNTHLY